MLIRANGELAFPGFTSEDFSTRATDVASVVLELSDLDQVLIHYKQLLLVNFTDFTIMIKERLNLSGILNLTLEQE